MKLAGSLGLDVTVFDEKAMEKLGMGCLLGVAKGSHQKPRMVVIEYHGGKKDDTPVALVGKGLTFDSGGISFVSDGKQDLLLLRRKLEQQRFIHEPMV